MTLIFLIPVLFVAIIVGLVLASAALSKRQDEDRNKIIDNKYKGNGRK